MKRAIFLFLVLTIFSVATINAQHFNYLANFEDLSKFTIIDSAHLKCSYKLTYLKDSLDRDNKSSDRQVLLVGKNISKYYSQYALDYNHFVVEHLKTHETYQRTPNKGAWSYEVFKNYPQGKETVTDIASTLRKSFLYEDNLSIPQWQITNEKQKILSYDCQKATTTFRGRQYVAWFTTEIPIPNGPWKFGGLPGLILKIYDSKENFIFECDGIELLKKKEPIKFYRIGYNKITRQNLNRVYQRFHDDRAAYLLTIGMPTMGRDPVTGEWVEVKSTKSKLPYNPIELK